MDKWMDERTHGWMDGQLDACMHECSDERMGGALSLSWRR